MKLSQTLLISIFLGYPFQTCGKSILQEYYPLDSCIETFEDNIDRDFCTQNILGQVISVDINDTQDNNEEREENDVGFIDLREKLFPKPGTSTTEKTQPNRRGNSSKKVSTLTFRSEQTTKRGEPSSPKGRSNATHPENVADFEKVGIPIDPMRNPNKKPDGIQNWKWDKNKKKWIISGERRVKVGDKIMTEREWQSMMLNHSGRA